MANLIIMMTVVVRAIIRFTKIKIHVWVVSVVSHMMIGLRNSGCNVRVASHGMRWLKNASVSMYIKRRISFGIVRPVYPQTELKRSENKHETKFISENKNTSTSSLDRMHYSEVLCLFFEVFQNLITCIAKVIDSFAFRFTSKPHWSK
jgi:hypothetical protein